MLRKLLKYEFQSTARVFLPFYGALVIMSFLARLTVWNYDETSQWMGLLLGISVSLYIIAIVAVMVVTTVVTVVRYYRNLYGDEGYLMQTLPVTADQLIWSKLIVSFVWHMVSVAMVVLALVILAWERKSWLMLFYVIYENWQTEIAPDITGSVAAAGVELVVGCLLSTFAGILTYYTAISLGQMMGKHRVLGAVASYIGITVFWQLVFGVVTNILFIAGGFPMQDLMSAVHLLMWFILIGALVQGIPQYLVTRWALMKKTNLA